MKTELEYTNKIKEVRKQMFWRLYLLPWIFLVFLLLCSTIYFYSVSTQIPEVPENPENDMEELILKNTEELILMRNDMIEKLISVGKNIIRNEAIQLGYGEYGIDDHFSWVNIESNKLSRTFEFEDAENNRLGFTYLDLDFADSLGMDLEGDLKNDMRIYFNSIEGKNINRKRLLSDLERIIEKRFKGFETYKKVK
jgi:hypothetical protein